MVKDEIRRKTGVIDKGGTHFETVSGGTALSQRRSEVRTKSAGGQAGTSFLLTPAACGQ